jgi:hypothetical protein
MNEPKSGDENIPSATEPSGGAREPGVKPSEILSVVYSDLKVLAHWLEPQAKNERIKRRFLSSIMALEDLIIEFQLVERDGWRAQSGGSWPKRKAESDQGLA